MGPSVEDNNLLYDYIEKIISDKAEIKLLFYEDFNGDQEQENRYKSSSYQLSDKIINRTERPLIPCT